MTQSRPGTAAVAVWLWLAVLAVGPAAAQDQIVSPGINLVADIPLIPDQ